MSVSDPSALSQLGTIYESLIKAPTKEKTEALPKEVQVFVRVQQTTSADVPNPTLKHTITIERKHAPRKFWIWLTGSSDQYKFEDNVKHFGALLQQGFKELASKECTSEEINKVVTCFRYYQDLVQYYAAKHYKDTPTVGPNPQKSPKEQFLNEKLFLPIEELEKELQTWKNGDDDGKKLFATYAIPLIEDAKKKALHKDFDDASKTVILSNVFSFLIEATRWTDFSYLSLSTHLSYIRKQIPENSPLRKNFDLIQEKWTALQNHTRPLSSRLNASALKEKLEMICSELKDQLLALQNGLPRQETATITQRPKEPEDIDRHEQYTVQQAAVAQRADELLALAQHFEKFEGIEELRALTTPDPDPALLQSAEKTLNRFQETISTILKANIYALPTPEHGSRTATRLTQLRQDAEKAQTSSDLLRIYEELMGCELEELQPREVVIPDFTPSVPKEPTDGKGGVHTSEGAQLPAPSNAKVRQTDSGQIPEALSSREKPKALERQKIVKPSVLDEELSSIIEKIRSKIDELTAYPRFNGQAEILAFATSRLALAKTSTSSLQKLLNLDKTLFNIIKLVEMSPRNEKQQQLRLWALRALSISLSNQAKKNEDFVSTIEQFCRRAWSTLVEIGKEEKAVNIESTLEKIDAGKTRDMREVALSYVEHGQEYYNQAGDGYAQLSDPSSVAFQDPTQWDKVYDQFCLLRDPIEKNIVQVLSSIEHLEEIIGETVQTRKDLLRNVGSIPTSYSQEPGVLQALKLVESLTEQNQDSIEDWHTRVIHLSAFVERLKKIFPLRIGNEASRHLKMWMLFGVACAYKQYQDGRIDKKSLAASLDTFSEKALEDISQAQQRDLYDMGERRESWMPRIAKLPEGSIDMPSSAISETYLPDFKEPLRTPLADPLNWTAITDTWREKRREQIETYSHVELRLAMAERGSSTHEGTLIALRTISQELNGTKYFKKVTELMGANIARELIPHEDELASGPPDRLKSLLAVLQGFKACIDILTSERDVTEYQKQVARIALDNLTKIVRQYRLPTPQESEKGPLEFPEEVLATFEHLINIQQSPSPLSETSQRNLASELASVQKHLKEFPDLVSSVLDTEISFQQPLPQGAIPTTSSTKTFQISGQDLLSGIEALTTSLPSSIEELEHNREDAAVGLSALRKAIDDRLQAIYEEKLAALKVRFSKLQTSTMDEYDQELIGWAQAYLKTLPSRIEDPTSNYLALRDLAQIENILLIRHSKEKPLQQRFSALQTAFERETPLPSIYLEEWKEAQKLYDTLEHPSFHAGQSMVDIQKVFSEQRKRLHELLDSLEHKCKHAHIIHDIDMFDQAYEPCVRALQSLSSALERVKKVEGVTEKEAVEAQEFLTEKIALLQTSPLRSHSRLPLDWQKVSLQHTQALDQEKIAIVELFQEIEGVITGTIGYLQHIGQSQDISQAVDSLNTLRRLPGIQPSDSQSTGM